MNSRTKIYLYTLFALAGFFAAPAPSSAAEALTVQIDGIPVTVPKKTLNDWLEYTSTADTPLFLGGGKTHSTKYSPVHVYEWVEEQMKNVNQESAEGTLVIQNKRATEFTPPTIGKRLDVTATTRAILLALSQNKTEATAVVVNMEFKNALAETNKLGIKELIGRGESIFKGSPKNRRHNIKIGVEKLKGLILAPGEEFSFNENICPVDKDGGYLPELVIKKEGTIPEYGGGLCQVSSTVFRGAMDAGLKIVQRKNHSYAVQYYAPQGTDATTYCGGVDFKFKNDTANHVLVWPYFEEGDKLVFDFYGTKDGRVVELEKPVQYDKKTDGSMKATWVRRVTKDGETLTDTFKSNYLPPALFHKEEKLDDTPPTSATGGVGAPTTSVGAGQTTPTPTPTPTGIPSPTHTSSTP